VAGIDDAIAALEGMRDRALAGGAAAAANAMGMHFIEHERRVTLLESGTHARGTRGAAPRGRPPARVTGWLGQSFVLTPARGSGLSASSLAGPTAIYARLQELGGRIVPVRAKFLHWVDYGGPQYRKHVYVGPHPYMERGLNEVIADGSLRDAAAQAFAEVVLA
jgi:hypothetical protein